MREAFRGGWPFSHPPNTDFELNWRSPQADGLVMWLPLGINRSTGSRHVDRVRKSTFVEAGTPDWVVDGQRGWSLDFDAASSESLQVSTALLAAAPLTMSGWAFYSVAPSTYGDEYSLFQISDALGAQDWFQIRIDEADDTLEYSARRAGAYDPAEPTAACPTGEWFHWCGVEVTTSLRACYLNGGNKGTDNNLKVPINLDQTTIGAYDVNGLVENWMNGRLANICLYNRALSDAEVYQQYINPWELIMPRVRFWPGFADGCVTTVTITETTTVTVTAQV